MRLAAGLLSVLMVCVAFVGCEPKISATKQVTETKETTEAKVQRPTAPPPSR